MLITMKTKKVAFYQSKFKLAWKVKNTEISNTIVIKKAVSSI